MVQKPLKGMTDREEFVTMEVTQGVRFDSLGLSPEIMRALEKKG